LAWLGASAYYKEEKMLQPAYLNRHNSVEAFMLKLVVGHVPRDDLQVLKPQLAGSAVYKGLLGFGVGKGHDLCIGKHLGEIKRSGSPTAPRKELSVAIKN
jgi:hypothetical protein